MGINGTSCFYKTVPISIHNAKQAIDALRELNSPQNTEDGGENQTSALLPGAAMMAARRSGIAIDANCLAYKDLRKPAEFVMQVAKHLSCLMFDVHIIADHPTYRHPSKRASFQR